MRKPVVLRGPIPTVEELAQRMGMSASRLAELRRFTDKLIAERENGRGRRVATKKAGKTSTATKKKRAAKTNRLKQK